MATPTPLPVIKPAALDYNNTAQTVWSRYQFGNSYPEQGQPTASLTSTVTSAFKIPGSAIINLANSELSICVLLPAQGASTYGFIHTACPPIQSVRLLTRRGGQAIVDIPSYRHFAKMILPVVTKRDLMKQSPSTAAKGTAAATTSSAGAFAISGTWDSTGALITSAGAQASTAQPYDAPSQFVVSGSNAAVSYNWRFRLGDAFPHTALAITQDIHPYDELYLEVVWCAGQNVAFKGDAATIGTAAAATGAFAYSNAQLYYAMQINPLIRTWVMERCRANLFLPCQSVFIASDLVLEAAGLALSSKMHSFTGANGQAVLRIYATAFLADDSKALSANCSNGSATIWSAYRAAVNGTPDGDAQSLIERYSVQRDGLHDTCLSNYEAWIASSAVVVQDYSGVEGSYSKLALMTPVGGVPIRDALSFTHEITRSSTTLASTWYAIYVMQRTFQCGPAGCMVI